MEEMVLSSQHIYTVVVLRERATITSLDTPKPTHAHIVLGLAGTFHMPTLSLRNIFLMIRTSLGSAAAAVLLLLGAHRENLS